MIFADNDDGMIAKNANNYTGQNRKEDSKEYIVAMSQSNAALHAILKIYSAGCALFLLFPTVNCFTLGDIKRRDENRYYSGLI